MEIGMITDLKKCRAMWPCVEENVRTRRMRINRGEVTHTKDLGVSKAGFLCYNLGLKLHRDRTHPEREYIQLEVRQ